MVDIHIIFIFAAPGVLLFLLNAVRWSRELSEILCHGAGGQLVSLLHLSSLHPLRISAHLHLEGLHASARGAAQDFKLFWRLSWCAAEKWKAFLEPR